MTCALPGCNKPLRQEQIRRGGRYHSTWCANLAKNLKRADVPMEKKRLIILGGAPAEMTCYCGRRFRVGDEGTRACFCSKACELNWIKGCYLNLDDYQRKLQER